MTKPVLAKLEASLTTARELNDALRSELQRARDDTKSFKDAANDATEYRDQLRKDINEMKERLLASERLIERMSGYISRVQEDDTVREELIETGDRATGMIQLVPKRKSTRFPIPSDFNNGPVAQLRGFSPDGYMDERSAEQHRSRNWVTY